jgi:hypothetical protein
MTESHLREGCHPKGRHRAGLQAVCCTNVGVWTTTVARWVGWTSVWGWLSGWVEVCTREAHTIRWSRLGQSRPLLTDMELLMHKQQHHARLERQCSSSSCLPEGRDVVLRMHLESALCMCTTSSPVQVAV